MGAAMRTRTPLAEPNAMLFEHFVDADEAARFLKVDRRTAIRWAREGIIPAHPLREDAQRKEWRFLLSELDEWLRSQVHSDRRPCPASRRIQ
jgi:excisionase family DNA binding protein